MDKDQLSLFIETTRNIMFDAGTLAVSSQKGIKNIGKEHEDLEEDSGHEKIKRGAKTIIDDKVQEMILRAALKLFDRKSLQVDAEEFTPTTKLFASDAKLTLVIDPIDGTLEYLEGKEGYSIAVGLISEGKILSTLVYFPAFKKLYHLDVDANPYRTEYSNNFQIIKKIKLEAPSKIKNNRVYRNNRVNQEITNRVKKKGYLIDDYTQGNWSEALIDCIFGEYYACIFHTPQIRDILIGAIIEHIPGGYAVDWQGRQLIWPDGGRISRAMFGFGKPQKEMIDCLKG